MSEDKNLFEAIGQAFGFKRKEKSPPVLPSIVTKKDEYDGAIEIASAASGVYGTYVDIEGKISNDFDLISKYRDLALQPEIDFAISDIVNEAIIIDNIDDPVELNLDDIEFSDKIKKSISDEFEYIIRLLNFNNKGHDIFRQFYIDGRLYYHTIIDEKNPKSGIQEIRNIDPRKLKKIREVKKGKTETGVDVIVGTEEYFLFNNQGFGSISTGGSNSMNLTAQAVRLSQDIVTSVTSGILDSNNVTVLSHLHKAMKPLNQLRMLEDSVVIYRLARAPERRIFYVDTGNLPKAKAEEYLASIMARYKNKMVYDVATGEIRDDKRHMSMLEDYWIPRREGGKGTEITTLPAGQSLGQLDDVDYFKKRLMRSLNVPYSRLDTENQWTLGRATEITRDEVRFNRFIERLRNKFNDLFDSLLEKQLILKGIVSPEDWKDIKNDLKYKYNKDSYFSEMKDAEVLKERFNLLQIVDPYSTTAVAGENKKPYFSQEWVSRNVLQQSEEDLKKMRKEVETELSEIESEAEPETKDGDQGEDQQNPQQQTNPDIPDPERVDLNKSDSTGRIKSIKHITYK